MSRDLDATLLAALLGNSIAPVILADLTFNSGVVHAWSGVGSLSFNSNTYLGVGSMGRVGGVREGISVRADGTSVTLSGIDSSLLTDCLSDIQIGAAAVLWFGLLSQGALVGTPYQFFSGGVDKASIQTGPKTMSITLILENKLSNLQRGSNRRYTAADQRVDYPDDTAFNWVEILNDIALRWGS